MLPAQSIVRITAFADPSDIRFRILGYQSDSDSYTLETVISRHVFAVDRVILHAQLRTKQLTREKPRS